MNGSAVHGAARRHEGLPRDLPAEDALAIFLGATTPKQVQLEFFEIENLDQFIDGGLFHFLYLFLFRFSVGARSFAAQARLRARVARLAKRHAWSWDATS